MATRQTTHWLCEDVTGDSQPRRHSFQGGRQLRNTGLPLSVPKAFRKSSCKTTWVGLARRFGHPQTRHETPTRHETTYFPQSTPWPRPQRNLWCIAVFKAMNFKTPSIPDINPTRNNMKKYHKIRSKPNMKPQTTCVPGEVAGGGTMASGKKQLALCAVCCLSGGVPRTRAPYLLPVDQTQAETQAQI